MRVSKRVSSRIVAKCFVYVAVIELGQDVAEPGAQSGLGGEVLWSEEGPFI